MAQPADSPVSVINPKFCAPYSVELTIVRKVMNITDGNFVVKDVNGDIVFKVKEPLLSMHDRRVLLDTAGKTIVNYRDKIMTMHKRCEVFRGATSNAEDLLFTAKRRTCVPFGTPDLDVFLANNKAQEICDFKVKLLKDSCVFYAGDVDSSPTSPIIAHMFREEGLRSTLFGKDKFKVKVNPNIDHAFIIALITFLEDINSIGESHLLLSVAKTAINLT